MQDNLSPCAADALRQTRQVTIGETTVGIARLSEVLADVQSLGLSQDAEIKTEILQRIAQYNYIPPPLEEAYAKSLLAEYYSDRMKRRVDLALKKFDQMQGV